MSRGGFRPGAGRPKGSKSRLKAAVASLAESATAKAVAEGPSPLAFLLSVMRDEDQEMKLRIAAAGEAMPYVHRRLPQAVEITHTTPLSVEIITPLTRGEPTANPHR